MHETETLVIGAGIAGLMAAERLREAGERVLILDKGRGVGGRMATRRMGNGRADHGAQFFTVRSKQFGRYVQQWLDDGLIFQWASGWSDDPERDAEQDGHPRYAGQDGMTAVPKALAKNHDVRITTRVARVDAAGRGWRVIDDEGTVYQAKKLIMTPPVPQSLALLDAGGVSLHPDDRAALQRLAYDPCLAGMFVIDGDVNLPEPGALQRPDHIYPWLADNQRKGISSASKLITVHAGPDLSQAHWDAPDEVKLGMLLDGLRPFLASDATVKQGQVHRWRYAQPSTRHPNRVLTAQNLPPLAFAGDAFKESRVEGAALSGLAAANALLAQSL